MTQITQEGLWLVQQGRVWVRVGGQLVLANAAPWEPQERFALPSCLLHPFWLLCQPCCSCSSATFLQNMEGRAARLYIQVAPCSPQRGRESPHLTRGWALGPGVAQEATGPGGKPPADVAGQ